MADWLATSLERWVDAGLLEKTAAEKIRAFEAERDSTGGLRWQVVLALGFGALLVGAGVLLFVSAHWDRISPASRFALVLAMVAVFHVAGALTERAFPALATALHALGTAALGAGIFLTGQIFNLDEHWPAALMVWAAGAWLGFWLRRDWVQGTLACLLTPAWLAGEWDVAAGRFIGYETVVARGILLLALAYLSARASGLDSPLRRALVWCGGLALLPAAILLFVGGGSRWRQSLPESLELWGLAAGLGLPFAAAWLLRRRDAWVLLACTVWVFALEFMVRETEGDAILQYFWLAVGAVGLVAWGLKDRRKERVNLGVVGFALTVLAFYSSRVLDKMERSVGMVGLGLLFLGGGWLLERMRRRLVARLEDRP